MLQVVLRGGFLESRFCALERHDSKYLSNCAEQVAEATLIDGFANQCNVSCVGDLSSGGDAEEEHFI